MEYRLANERDIETLISIRLEMLRVVNNLADDFCFSEAFITYTREYFLNGQQTTVLAVDGQKTVGCATMSYIHIMPTFSHVTGKRAHLMNVYTANEYRRKGIGKKMVELLIEDAKKKGATEISLDATDMGKPLYENIGFVHSDECMVMTLG